MSQLHEEVEAARDAAPPRKSGRAVFDDGRTVWEWQTATGVFERYVSEEQMSRLEAADLQLVEQSSPEEGRAIYGSRPTVNNNLRATERVFVSRPAGRSVSRESVSVLRSFWRRLVPSF
jgi:hypothetical protein